MKCVKENVCLLHVASHERRVLFAQVLGPTEVELGYTCVLLTSALPPLQVKWYA